MDDLFGVSVGNGIPIYSHTKRVMEMACVALARELSKDGESPQAALYRNQIQKLVSQVQVFIEAMKNLQKLIGSKVTDASGNVVPPDKAQVKLCKEKFEVSQKIMEQTIK